MSPKQRKFAEVYAGNATEAAVMAGFLSSNARNAGMRMMTNADVLAAIKAREETESRLRIASRQDRQEFWTRMMMDVTEKPEHRLKASELLGKSEADFVDKIQASVSVSAADLARQFAERRARNAG